MSTIGKWNFDNDPQILAEKERALGIYRQQAQTQRQHFEQGLRIIRSQLDGWNLDAQIAAEKAAGKRPLLDAERIKTQANQEKVVQARVNLQSAQLSTGIARDAYQGLMAERGIRQKLIGQKLRGLQLQAEQLRAATDAQHRSISTEYGRLQNPVAPSLGGG